MCVNATQCITSKLIYLSIVPQKINILNANIVCGGFFSLNCEKNSKPVQCLCNLDDTIRVGVDDGCPMDRKVKLK